MSKPKPRAGDAERRREAKSAANDAVIQTGNCRIFDAVFGTGKIVKVFKKSYRIHWDRSGNTFTRKKHFVKPI